MIHLISYGNELFKCSKNRLYREASQTGWFNTIQIYGPEDLDDNFKEKFKTMLSIPRGGGYWIWKSHIIKKRLSEISEGDILIYLDAGCSINKLGKFRLNQYIDMLNNSDYGIISFQMSHQEKQWTTKQVFSHFKIDMSSDIANSGQYVGGIRIMKKNKHLTDLIVYRRVLTYFE